MNPANDVDRAREALHAIPPNLPRDEWHTIGRAAIAAGLSIDDLNSWSATAENYKGRRDVESAFRTVQPTGGTGAGTLFHYAKQHGHSGTGGNSPALPLAKPSPSPTKPAKQAASINVADIWSRCIPATAAEPYIDRKGGKPDGLRVYPATAETLSIGGVNMTGALVIPCYAPDGKTLLTAQFIPIAGEKKNLPGSSFGDGFFTVGEVKDRVLICEGIGQAWAVNRATGSAAVVTFGSGRMAKVAAVLRKKYPDALLVLVPDRGKESQAAKIAAAVAGLMATMPGDKPDNFDANDYAAEHGDAALSDMLQRPIEPPIEYALSVAFADELTSEFTPPDEIVESLLTDGDGSILYGDSNSGKTFFVIDLACGVARGVPWMGKQTEPGLVIYLAAESPASVRSRIQAYQRHHDVKVPNFAIVQSPIDLFDGDADTDKLIQLVRQIERQKGQPARLIIGDTLARLSAGANENAGADMGLVVRRFDRIRAECKAHFMLIHHCGKNAAAGARGWSGVRAAVDTEIEVTDSPAGRCAEITKQRDLPSKGDRIGFRLQVVTMGLTKWNSPATSCVVMPADAPDKQSGKRASEVGGAVIEYLAARGAGVKKTELVKHFDTRYTKSAVYREIKKLVAGGSLHECAGIVAAVGFAGGAK